MANLIYSCPAISCPAFSCPAFSCPTISCPTFSCNAFSRPAFAVFYFNVLQFHALLFGPSFSRPAFLPLWILLVRHFHVLHFQSPLKDMFRELRQTRSQRAWIDDVHRRPCVTSRPEVDPTVRPTAFLVVVSVDTMSSRERTRSALWVRMSIGCTTSIRSSNRQVMNHVDVVVAVVLNRILYAMPGF